MMIELKQAIRNLYRYKSYTLINMIGLSLALMASVVLLLFAQYHLGFDKHINDKANSFRITTSLSEGTRWASTFAAFEDILPTCTEVKQHTVFYYNEDGLILRKGGINFPANNPLYANPDMPVFFNIKISKGDISGLNQPNTVLISEAAAKALFKGENPIGQSVQVTSSTNSSEQLQTSTVIGVLSENQNLSHLKYDLIHSKRGYFESTVERIINQKVYSAYVYLTLQNGICKDEFGSGFNEKLEPILGGSHGPQVEDFQFFLQPVKDIHFTPGLYRDFTAGINKRHLYILLLIGCLLFVTVAFNFMIMSIARAEKQINHSKIIRFIGGSRFNIIKSNVYENGILVLICVSIALFALNMHMPYIGNRFLNGWQVDMSSPELWLLILLLSLLILVISAVTKDVIHLLLNRNRKFSFSKSGSKKMVPLIVIQFAVVTALICFGVAIHKQLNYIHGKDLGYNSENIMVFRSPENRSEKINVFKEKAKAVPGVIGAANAQHYPGFRLQDITLETPKGNYPMKFAMVDEDALNVLGIEETERFSNIEGIEILINTTLYNSFLQNFTVDEIINGDFGSKQQEGSERLDYYVNGVVNDFHYNSLYEPIGNFMFFIRKTTEFNHRFMLVRYDMLNTHRVVSELQGIGQELYNVNIEPVFLNEELNKQYESEQRLLSVSGFFASLTVLIACMGLFAFVLFSTQRRTKEIGVRKVNGARMHDVLWSLTFNFLKWVAVSIAIAIPIAWYGISRWLETFAFRTTIDWWTFALPGSVVILIALATVIWQVFVTARRNPVEALRYE